MRSVRKLDSGGFSDYYTALFLHKKTKPFSLKACFRPLLQKCFEKNWASLEEERRSLEEERRILMAIAEDMREHLVSLNKLPSFEVDLWLESVAKLTSKKTQLQIEYEKLENSLNIRRCVQLGEKVRHELRDVRKLLEWQRKGFTTLCRPRRTVARAHEEPVGIEPLLNRLRGYLDDDERSRSSIIGIHGVTGVGKTMLLSVFNNQLVEREDYDVVIFIEVSNSQVLDVKFIQWIIFRRLDLTWNEAHREAMRAEIIREVLMTKKFVILLDDVHDSFKLKQVGIPDPDAINVKGKLFLASRSKDVCFRMEVRTEYMIEVKCLESESTWVLFHRYLGDEAKTAIERDHNIGSSAKAIVHSCSGLPLAIKAVGRAVASLTDLSSWENAAAKRVQQFSPEDLD